MEKTWGILIDFTLQDVCVCVCGGGAVPVPARIHQSHISQMFQTTRKQNLRGTNNFSSSVTVPFSPHSSEMSSTAVELDIICNWFKQTILLSLHSFLFTVHYCTYRYKSINCECVRHVEEDHGGGEAAGFMLKHFVLKQVADSVIRCQSAVLCTVTEAGPLHVH